MIDPLVDGATGYTFTWFEDNVERGSGISITGFTHLLETTGLFVRFHRPNDLTPGDSWILKTTGEDR